MCESQVSFIGKNIPLPSQASNHFSFSVFWRFIRARQKKLQEQINTRKWATATHSFPIKNDCVGDVRHLLDVQLFGKDLLEI